MLRKKLLSFDVSAFVGISNIIISCLQLTEMQCLKYKKKLRNDQTLSKLAHDSLPRTTWFEINISLCALTFGL